MSLDTITDRQPVAIITGATSGLGLECVRALLASTKPWRVVIASRNQDAGQRVRDGLNRRCGRQAVEYIRLDLGSLDSVREFAETVCSKHAEIDALICNAGLQFLSDTHRTTDGFEATFGINHLGHFLLFHRLASQLREDARVVVVSSGTHDPAQNTPIPTPRFISPELLARPELDAGGEFAGEDPPSTVGQRRYSTSKLCNLYFAYELNRRLRASGAESSLASIRVNAFDPGLMPGTGLARDHSGPLRFVWNYLLPLLKPLLRLRIGHNVNSPAVSGRALATLAAGLAPGDPTGEYFEGTKSIRSSTESYDERRWAELWTASEKMVWLQDDERVALWSA